MPRILLLILWLGVVTDLAAEPFIQKPAAIHIVLVGDSTVTDSAGFAPPPPHRK
jgi:hypothetical protein